MERHAFHVRAEQAERMHVAVAGAVPVGELDAQFEGALRVAQKVVFIDAQHLQEVADRRYRGLAHADSADPGGLDHADPRLPGVQEPGKCRGGHPAGRAAADNDYPPQIVGMPEAHAAQCPSMNSRCVGM